jgi:UDP-hydrolysing UDP-N-acetyl-D-glucosamine 2-epimerase
MRRRILVFIGSRANYGRLQSVLKAIIDNSNLTLQLILGASYYSENIGYNVDARIQCLCSGDDNESMVISASNMMMQFAHELTRLKPDIVLIHGDRFEVMPVALACHYMNIPIAHTEGGEETGCIDNGIRKMISVISTYDFVTTKGAEYSLMYQGKTKVYTVGSPAIDLLVQNYSYINRPISDKYILVLYHANTSNYENINSLIKEIVACPHKIIWVNPNVDAGNKKLLKFIHDETLINTKIEFVKDLSPIQYYQYLANCEYAIGNSSSFIKEGLFLGIPVVLIGDRQKNRECGNNIFYSSKEIKPFDKAIDQYMFGDGTAGERIVEVLSYE